MLLNSSSGYQVLCWSVCKTLRLQKEVSRLVRKMLKSVQSTCICLFTKRTVLSSFYSVRDGKVRKSVDRIFTIWAERNVYPEEVIAQFKTYLHKKEKDRVKQKEKEKEKEKEKAAPPVNGQFKGFVFKALFIEASMFLNSMFVFINARLFVLVFDILVIHLDLFLNFYFC